MFHLINQSHYNCIADRLRLNLGLQALLNQASETDFEELLFWGRISGLTADYYIAMGVTYSQQYEFPTKTFFFANSNDMIFRQFRDMNVLHKDEYDNISAPFDGDSNKIYIKIENETNPNEEQKEEIAEEPRDALEDTPPEDPDKGKVFRSLIEEDRLLYTVMAIENDCQICPHGAFRLTEAHEVERNVAFRGLPSDCCFSLLNYSHFRNVQDETKKELLLRDDAIFQPDFLDEVNGDQPRGMWSIQKDTTGQMAVIRNNVWAGFTAYHKAASGDFGGIYCGDGLKNRDICFML